MRMDYLLKVRQQVLEGIKATDTLTNLIAGKLEPRVYARYLTNVWHYAQHSAIVIGTAGSRCVTDDPALAHYLLHHAREELGHDQWALDDLAAMGIGEDAVRASRPTPSCAAMVGVECAAMVGVEYYTAMHANPVGLFGWMYVLEAMGDDLGFLASDRHANPVGLFGWMYVLEAMGDDLGFLASDSISSSMGLAGVKFLAGHGEADAEHTVDLTEQIAENVRDGDAADVNHVADVIAGLYVRMFEEISRD